VGPPTNWEFPLQGTWEESLTGGGERGTARLLEVQVVRDDGNSPSIPQGKADGRKRKMIRKSHSQRDFGRDTSEG